MKYVHVLHNFVFKT